MDEKELTEYYIKQKPGVTELDDTIITTPKQNTSHDTSNDNSGDTAKNTSRNYKPHGGRSTDDGGSTFDPAIHASNPDGTPKKTKAGKFAKRRGRKIAGSSDPVQHTERLSCREAGRVSAQAVFVSGQAAFGDEWKPIVDNESGVNEPENVTAAFAAYYEITGLREPPPWVMLAIVLGSYAGPRLTMPKTQSKLKRMVNYVGLRLKGWKKVKPEKEGE